MSLNYYLRLASLPDQSKEKTSLANQLHTIIASRPSRVRTVTLDLYDPEGNLLEAKFAPLVQVIQEHWPYPACCLARCQHLQARSRAAAYLSQPLLAWTSLNCQGGYQVLGPRPTGLAHALLRAFCLHYRQATARQVAQNITIASIQPASLKSADLAKLMIAGRLSNEPKLGDVTRIERHLRLMVAHRYPIEGTPGVYQAIHPVAPSHTDHREHVRKDRR